MPSICLIVPVWQLIRGSFMFGLNVSITFASVFIPTNFGKPPVDHLEQLRSFP